MFSCQFCGISVQTLREHVLHIKLHRNEPRCVFKCAAIDCHESFRSHGAFKAHFYRKHNIDSRVATTHTLAVLRCNISMCQHQCRDVKALLAHLKEHIAEGRVVTCPVTGCNHTFFVKSSFTSHISRKHRQCSLSSIRGLYRETVPQSFETEPLVTGPTERLNETDEGEVHLAENFSDLFLRNISLFYLKLHGQFLLPASTIQNIVEEMQSIHELGQTYSLKKLSAFLKNDLDLTDENIGRVCDVVKESDIFTTCHDGPMRTNFSRTKTFKEMFRYTEPVKLYLGTDETRSQRFAHYVPLKDTLRSLLESDLWQKCAAQDTCLPCTDVLCDVIDGQVYKNNEFFSQNPSCLKLILYQDSFEVVNPLGSAKSKHKVLAVYMSLANLPPHIRSSTDHMSLVMLCREKDFKHFGHEKVFSRLIADLKDLEDNGITVAEETFKGTVLCIAGDNLGSHNVGGFTENFSTSEYFCRYCRIARRDFQTDPNACGPQRTPENYNSAVDILQSEGHQNVEGITCKSIFNSLNYFNVCMPGLPPCLGHDIFEGILSYDLALYLKYFIKQKKWFTYSILNRRIKQFKYSASDALSKPCTVSSNGVKLSGQAIQNWNFLRLLPVIMGDKVKEPMDDVWQLTLQLKDIVEMICAHRISLPDVAYLDVLIQEYLSCRFSLFPGHRLKPKHHYLRHYPALILKLGPLIRLWTMRFEKMGESEMNISSITSAIDVILPDLPITTKQSLEDTLKSLGVDTPEDFRFLQESDLVAVLRPIQARKFISVLKETTQISETPRQQHCPSQGSVLSQSSSSSSSRTSSPLSVKWVDSFEVPWKNFPEELMQALERQKRPSPQLRREMESGMEVHFKDLTGIPLKETFLESIDRKGNRLLHFMRNICANKNKRVLQAVAKLQVLRGQRNGCSEDVKDMILLLLSYFDEKEEVLLRYVEETSLAKDVELENLPVTPCIIVCGPSCYAAVHFMLAVDRKIVNDNITSFISAVCLMLGSYYSFNIHYPTELASVLEFLQRCFFLINPEKGTKVVEKKNKKRLLVNPRVFTLISDLSDHEWRETS
ncbi:uncharacterized protein LOC130436632 isoform X2 [Triplophysa dalaica]|uniref:uncharacterized protein LOC130436632 isoform X2 n=2 Tax=Triplophysa dalaica TaxID=1582913 RepID=UPI0024E00B58|nr:uncharacterized protein LOC130436632 isoform X2 [Triplophysa dalaica]